MEDERKIPSETVVSEQQISDSFLCCICLDLLYKPIVLACGHISCFWCIHRSMNSLYKSQCPICRQSYNHFPAICQMLHFLFLKMYPVAYRQREIQILDEERKIGYFSPQIKACPNSSHIHKETDVMVDSTPSVAKISQLCMSGDSCSYEAKLSDQIEQESASELHESELAVMGDTSAAHSKATKAGLAEEMILPSDKVDASAYQVSVDDLLCNACKQLLLQPVVLNCGHAYCQTCIGMPRDDVLTCKVCESIHPHGFPKVCLELDHFLEEQFPKEYALRRNASRIIEVHFQNASSTTGSGERGISLLPSLRENLSWWTEHGSKIHGSKIHIRVGCDSCGIYPIIGERFRCKDCVEKIGYDLCGDCYKTSSKLPGRFNQQHTADHKFELVKPCALQMLRVINGQSEVGLPSFEPRIFDEVNPEDGSITITSLNDAQDQEDAEDGSIGITSLNDAQDQEDAEDGSTISSIPLDISFDGLDDDLLADQEYHEDAMS